VFARQPCDPILCSQDVGQWLCVPPFRVVCLYQAFTRAVKDACVPSTQQQWSGTGGAARRARGTPAEALHESALTGRILPACISALSLEQSVCQPRSTGGGCLAGRACTGRPAEARNAGRGEMDQGLGKNCVAGGPGCPVVTATVVQAWGYPQRGHTGRRTRRPAQRLGLPSARASG
jgi:hypothetical protein